jgi:hypothetical protein
MSRWRRFLRLPGRERWLRLRALGRVAEARLRLSFLPFRRVRSWCDAAAIPADGPADRFSPADVDRAVRSAATFVPGATCLVRAMAARVLLGRCGHPSRLLLGLRRGEGGDLDAHAWVECGAGTVVGQRSPEDHASVGI